MKIKFSRGLFFILIFTILFTSTPVFANEPGESKYRVVVVNETPYGTAFYLQENSKIQTRSFWDVVDILMAGKSWADLFSEPSWANFGWAVLDTAAILPLLPSTAYFRQGGKVMLKADEVAKFAKTSAGKKVIKSAMKTFKYSDGITTSVRKAIEREFKKSPQTAKNIISAFEKAANKGFVGASKQNGIKKLTGKINKIYTHEIKILGEYGAYRIYGYQTKSGEWIFDFFVKSHK